MPNTTSPSTLLEALHWRYATKKFDPARKLPVETLETLKQAAVLAPSSYGLQPWKILLVTDAAVRAKLRAASWNQPQITDASHLFVFAIKKEMGEAEINAYIQRISEVRHARVEALAGYRDMMVGMVVNGPLKPVINDWSKRQAYIGLGTLLAAAALLGVDACPMEGFDPAQYDEILGLPAQKLAATVVATVGYRAADDPAAAMPKVRFDVKDVVINV